MKRAFQRRPIAEPQLELAPPVPPAEAQPTYTISRYRRHWQVLDPAGELVCLTVYKCGAEEVVLRLTELQLQLDAAANSPALLGTISEPPF